MRIFTSLKEVDSEIKRDLHEMGVRVHTGSMQNKITKGDKAYETLELFGYSYRLDLTNFQDFESIKKEIQLVTSESMYKYIIQEWMDRFNPTKSNPGNAWTFRKHVWEKYLVNGFFDYTYNERLQPQLGDLTNLLIKFPYSRQALLTVYNSTKDHDKRGGKARVPCSMYYQVFIRNNKLDMIYNMRSCDFFTHFIVDISLAILTQYSILKALQPSVPTLQGIGSIIHQINSLHIYNKDTDKGVF